MINIRDPKSSLCEESNSVWSRFEQKHGFSDDGVFCLEMDKYFL